MKVEVQQLELGIIGKLMKWCKKNLIMTSLIEGVTSYLHGKCCHDICNLILYMLYTENTDMNVYHLFPTLCSFFGLHLWLMNNVTWILKTLLEDGIFERISYFGGGRKFYFCSRGGVS